MRPRDVIFLYTVVKFLDDLPILFRILFHVVSVLIHVGDLVRRRDISFIVTALKALVSFLIVHVSGPSVVPDIPEALIRVIEVIRGRHLVVAESQVETLLSVVVSAEAQHHIRILLRLDDVFHGFRIKKDLFV